MGGPRFLDIGLYQVALLDHDLSALQTMDGQDVVFVRKELDTYEQRPVEAGARDSQRVQILEGLEPGEQVVDAESYLIKADLEKEGAEHAH